MHLSRPVWSADKVRQPLPVSGDAERPLSPRVRPRPLGGYAIKLLRLQNEMIQTFDRRGLL
jgi:hypothetical protein